MPSGPNGFASPSTRVPMIEHVHLGQGQHDRAGSGGAVWKSLCWLWAAVFIGVGVLVGAGATASPAGAEANGVGLKPAMGWSSWSFLRHGPTAANIEAEARAMVTSGLVKVGYRYVNLDDFWYICPGSQGPKVDRYGRWVPNARTFPPRSSGPPSTSGPSSSSAPPSSSGPPSTSGENGIQVVADYVHSLGLKFGLYVTPGISKQAVAEHTPILAADGRPSGFTANEIARPSFSEYNYNCGGMVGINYKAPGAQDFINSWADEFARWGIDYLKLDGVGRFDIPDVRAWSDGLRQTGTAHPSRAFQQPEHRLRLHMGAVLQWLADRQRHRVLLVRDQRLQLPAHGLRQR